MDFFQHSALLAAGAVVLVHEALKVIPNSIAQRFPVVTNIALSIIASLVAVWQDTVTHPQSWTDWLLLVGTVSVVAAIIYNQIVSKREVLKVNSAVKTVPNTKPLVIQPDTVGRQGSLKG